MSGNRSYLDPELTRLLGPVDAHTARAIAGICDDALVAVLGQPLASAAQADPALMARVAPGVPDRRAACNSRTPAARGRPDHQPAHPPGPQATSRPSAALLR